MGDRKVHNRKQTIDGIEQAIEQLQASQGKLSISAVAKMAGVTPALIHNTYPDLAEKIRGLVGKATRTQRDAKHSALVRERESIGRYGRNLSRLGQQSRSLRRSIKRC